MKYKRADVEAHVEIKGRATDGVYELSVEDNGRGMTPDDASRVFEPFYRVAGGGGAPGTGLGLSIVRRVVEASGGTVSVSSEVGHGTAFVTRLPLVDAECSCREGRR
jgi:signal transduction histidine kinase